jgi:hypothetical protein
MEYIALDVHKRYTWARVENAHGDRVTEQRVLHQRGAIQGSRRSGRAMGRGIGSLMCDCKT